MPFEKEVLPFEKGVLSFEKGVLAFAKGVIAFDMRRESQRVPTAYNLTRCMVLAPFNSVTRFRSVGYAIE